MGSPPAPSQPGQPAGSEGSGATPQWRFLVDENLPEPLVEIIRAHGHVAEHARLHVHVRG
jgi:hypothetical protein